MAQQGPPPRRHARPPAPDWPEQPPAQEEADPQAQPAGGADQQGQDTWAAPQPPAGWQQQPPAGWSEPQQATGAHAAPAGWQEQAAPPGWQAQPGWQGQPAPADWPGQAPAGDRGWSGPAARHSAGPGWETPPAPPPAGPGWGGQAADPGWSGPAAPQAWPEEAQVSALDLAAEDRIAWPEEPQPAPAAVGSGWRNAPVRQPGRTAEPDADELPPWAGLSIMPQRPAREGRTFSPQRGGAVPAQEEEASQEAAGRGLTRRAIATRARKARRKLVIGGSTAIVAVVVAAGVWLLFFRPSHPKPAAVTFVQTFQPGEMRTVPDACQVITSSVLGQYLPGHPSRVHSASLNGQTSSQCTWTLDAKPVYRVLEVTDEAYAPSGLNTGNGSATNGAIDAFNDAEQELAHPAKSTRLPAAAVSSQPGLGDTAFSAVQVIRRAGTVNDLVTVVIRDRNVLITVAFQGEQRAAGGGYGPVSLSTLQAGTAAAARQVLAALPNRR